MIAYSYHQKYDYKFSIYPSGTLNTIKCNKSAALLKHSGSELIWTYTLSNTLLITGHAWFINSELPLIEFIMLYNVLMQLVYSSALSLWLLSVSSIIGLYYSWNLLDKLRMRLAAIGVTFSGYISTMIWIVFTSSSYSEEMRRLRTWVTICTTSMFAIKLAKEGFLIYYWSVIADCTATPTFLLDMLLIIALNIAAMCPSCLKLSFYYFLYNSSVVLMTMGAFELSSQNKLLLMTPSMCLRTSGWDRILSLRDVNKNIMLSFICMSLPELLMLSNILAIICCRNSLDIWRCCLTKACLFRTKPELGSKGLPASSARVTCEPILLES